MVRSESLDSKRENVMYRSWRLCVEEYQEAKETIGAAGALAFVSLLVVLTPVGLVVILVVGFLALTLSAPVLAVALMTMFTAGSDREDSGLK
jgi:hypothetical protein